jgi:hypothetical protein
MKAKADIVVLCSSDDEYAQYAIPAFKALTVVLSLLLPVHLLVWKI